MRESGTDVRVTETGGDLFAKLHGAIRKRTLQNRTNAETARLAGRLRRADLAAQNDYSFI